MFAFLREGRRRKDAAQALYLAACTQARQPVFYSRWGIPDTSGGRFELMVLHAFLVWNRLQEEGHTGAALAQGMFDAMFRDMECALRQMGTGDLSVPVHMKRMMRGFKGRALAYQKACAEGHEALEAALLRNLFGTVEKPSPESLAFFAAYIRKNIAALARQSLTDGTIFFEGSSHEQEEKSPPDARMAA